jgi:aspartyl-tRNA synthetase
VDIADIVGKSGFKVFTNIINSGGQVKGINASGCGYYSRKEIDELTKYCTIFGGKGLAWMIVAEEGIKSPIAKFFTEEQLTCLIDRMQAKAGDLLLLLLINLLLSLTVWAIYDRKLPEERI